MAGKFELKKSTNGKFYFTLKAGNDEPILNSESYEAKQGAEGGIEAVKKNAPIDDRYNRETSSRSEPYFVLKAGNNEPLGRSEMYSSTSAMEKGIDSVKANAPSAAVSDLT